MTKVFKKDHYEKVMGVHSAPGEEMTSEEKAANFYANEADGNPIDEFTLGDKLLMRAAFLAGIEWERKRIASESKMR